MKITKNTTIQFTMGDNGKLIPMNPIDSFNESILGLGSGLVIELGGYEFTSEMCQSYSEILKMLKNWDIITKIVEMIYINSGNDRVKTIKRFRELFDVNLRVAASVVDEFITES